MKLLWFEWKKLWKNASVLKIAVFLIFMSTIIFWGELKKDKEWTSEYLKMHEIADEMSQDDLSGWLEGERKENNNFENEDLHYAKYKAQNCIEEEIDAIGNYDSYRDTIQKRYEQSKSISIFSDADGHQERYMKQIAETYKNLQIKAPMKLQPYKGIQELLGFYVGDLLAIVFLIYLVSVVFIQEKKNGKMEFAFTTSRGRGQLFAAKTMTVYGSLVLYMLFSFLLNAVSAFCIYGFISLGTAIQSVPELFSVPYAWTIGQYLAAYLLLKSVAALLLTATAIMIAKYFTSETVATIGMAGIVGLSVWAENTFTGDGFQNVLRQWNIWSILRGKSIIGNYELIQMGDWIIEVICGIPIMIVLALLLLFFAEKSRQRERKNRSRKVQKGKKIPHTIFFYEMKKMWIYQGGIFLFAVCMLIEGTVIWQYHDYLGTDEFYYQQYIDRFGERVTEDTEKLISREEIRLKGIEENLACETDVVKSIVLQQDLECQGGFRKYVDRVNRLKQDKEEKILLKDVQYRILFECTEVSKMMVILLCVSFALIIPPVFQKEKETGVEVLQKIGKNGGSKLWRAKISSLLLFVIPMILLFDMLIFLKENINYNLKLKAPVDCLDIYWNMGLSWSVCVVFLMGAFMQCLIAAAVTILLSYCAKRVKNQHMMTGVILGGTVIPTLLISHSPVRWISWVHDLFFVFTERKVWTAGVIVLAAFWMMRKECKL